MIFKQSGFIILIINYLFYVQARQSGSTLRDGKRKQNPRVVTTILIANTDTAAVHHGDPTMAAF